jgi:hypothetical protein
VDLAVRRYILARRESRRRISTGHKWSCPERVRSARRLTGCHRRLVPQLFVSLGRGPFLPALVGFAELTPRSAQNALRITYKNVGWGFTIEQCMWRVEPECAPPPATILRVTGQQLQQILCPSAEKLHVAVTKDPLIDGTPCSNYDIRSKPITGAQTVMSARGELTNP